MPKTVKDETPNRNTLDEFVRGMRQAAALKAALELEIFTRIAEGNCSLPSLLRVSGLNERGVRILLDALANINLLTKTAFEYLLTPTAETFLVKGKPTYYGDALLAGLAWDARGQTARAVRSGKPLNALMTDSTARAVWARATWIDWQAAVQGFASVWEQLGIGEKNTPVRALAYGAEAGLRLLSLAQRAHNTQISVVDSELALEPLKSASEALRVQAQVQFLSGDWLSVSLPADTFNLVFVDSLTTYLGLEQNIGLAHRALEAMAMGGRIVLRAVMADEERAGPHLVPLEGLDVLIASVAGDIYTPTEYRGILEAAGFFEIKAIGEWPGILTARRIPPPPPPPPAATVAPDFVPPPETLE